MTQLSANEDFLEWTDPFLLYFSWAGNLGGRHIPHHWDRLHKTIRLNIPQQQINIGVPSYRDPEEQNIKNLILMPFRKPRSWQLSDGTVPERKSDWNRDSMEP